MRLRLFYVLVLALFFAACKRSGKGVNEATIDSVDFSDKTPIVAELDSAGTGVPIFYNMYLSVELSSLFETAGAVYSNEILNNYDKNSDYITSYKKAMNLGVYAVDLSYCRAFEQYEIAGRYFSAMQVLSEQLGIPQDYFENTAQRFEKNITNKDSLISIANEVYYETQKYLKENERYATASVIILGGWVEAIYVGTDVAIESKNVNIIERLIDQKYSLNNLLIMLKDYSDNENVSEYITKLQELRKIFDSLAIDIPAGFVGKSAAEKAQLDKWILEIKRLQTSVITIRKDIIG
jgi:predicted CopG family antitoxin